MLSGSESEQAVAVAQVLHAVHPKNPDPSRFVFDLGDRVEYAVFLRNKAGVHEWRPGLVVSVARANRIGIFTDVLLDSLDARIGVSPLMPVRYVNPQHIRRPGGSLQMGDLVQVLGNPRFPYPGGVVDGRVTGGFDVYFREDDLVARFELRELLRLRRVAS